MIYTFLSMAAKSGYPSYENNFERTIQSFQRLTDPKRLNVQARSAVRSAARPPTRALRNFLPG